MNDTNEPNQPATQTPPSRPFKNFLRELITFVLFALVIVIPIRLLVAEPFVVSGDSMDPTFATGQYLIVNQLSYHFENPERGQVIIFRYPKDPSEFFIKRVIGLPGEEVQLNGATTTICRNPPSCTNSFALSEPYVQPANQSDNPPGSITLGQNEYFVMGDNRRESSDSRSWGPVPRDLIIGTPVLRLVPLSEFAFIPGNYAEPANNL
jgi:signal peptidase I